MAILWFPSLRWAQMDPLTLPWLWPLAARLAPFWAVLGLGPKGHAWLVPGVKKDPQNGCFCSGFDEGKITENGAIWADFGWCSLPKQGRSGHRHAKVGQNGGKSHFISLILRFGQLFRLHNLNVCLLWTVWEGSGTTGSEILSVRCSETAIWSKFGQPHTPLKARVGQKMCCGHIFGCVAQFALPRALR